MKNWTVQQRTREVPLFGAYVLVAGRCFSGDRLALSSTRVMPTGCLMGQACGTAAALAVSRDQPLRDVKAADIRAQLLAGATDADYMAERLAPPEHAPDTAQMLHVKGGAA